MKRQGLEEDFVKLEGSWGGRSEHLPCGGIGRIKDAQAVPVGISHGKKFI